MEVHLSATDTSEGGLPTRSRRRPGHSALDGPTIPISLPVTGSPGPGLPQRPLDTRDQPADAPAPAGGAAAATEPGEAGPVESVRTESGLPVRIRQASITPALRAEPEAAEEDEDVIREPEQVRRMMSSYQTGTRRGRTDAARLLGGGGRPGDADESDGADQQES